MTEEEIFARDRDAAERGERAEREYAELEHAFQAVRDAVAREMSQTPVTQPDKVLKLHMGLSNLAAVETAITLVIRNGRNAREAIALAGLTRP